MQLSIWGKWSVAKSAKSVGYSPVCPMFKDAAHGAYRSNPPMGVSVDATQNILDTDAAVARLGQEERRLCIEYYVIGGKAADVARRLGIARQRLYERLHRVHQELLGHLNDVAAEC